MVSSRSHSFRMNAAQQNPKREKNIFRFNQFAHFHLSVFLHAAGICFVLLFKIEWQRKRARANKYKMRAWQIGLVVQTRTIVIINECCSLSVDSTKTSTADYMNSVWMYAVGLEMLHSHSIRVWWNGKTFYCRLFIGIVDPWQCCIKC